MKKMLMPALIAVIVIQLFVPVYMIVNKYDILKTGEEFKFRVSPVDPYDAFRGRYVSLYPEQGQGSYGGGRYGVIAVGADGFARVSSVSDKKPASGAYVKSSDRFSFSLPVDRYYMNEKLAPEAEALVQQGEAGKEAYVTARVKNGGLIVTGLFIDGVAIEDIIRNGS